LVALILLRGDIGGAVVGEKDQPLIRLHHDAATAWALGLFATRIFLPSSVDVGTSREGMFEHGL
jgi:hypothetical protein